MRKLFLICLFAVGLVWVLSNFKGLANQGTYDSIVLDFREDIPAVQISNSLETISQKYQVAPQLNSEFSTTDNIYIVKGDKNLLKTLRNSEIGKKTETIEPNYQYKAFEAPNDPDYVKQWNLRSINVESAWEETKGAGMTVAVIDTGVTQVPDLEQTKFVKGYDFVNDKIEAYDDNGHGTHVAGTIAQSTNNNYGVAGVAYEASIMPLKVLSAYGGGTVADIAEAIRFAADNGADVINLSLGGGGESQVLKEAVDYAYNKGVVVVAAAGNENRNSASYPARYPHAISVAATGPSGEKAPYSNFGAGVDISAPGGSKDGPILQETIDPETGSAMFAGLQGTSMASPHVAAVAAMVKASG
ncbi:MAG: S8 family peptidase, partial [Phormidium sp.]